MKKIILSCLIVLGSARVGFEDVTVPSLDGKPVSVAFQPPVLDDSNCNPPSGSAFPVGTTPVACQANFSVTVTPPTKFDWTQNSLLGSFRLPRGQFFGTNFNFQGVGMAYDALRDSLFVTGRSNDFVPVANGGLNGERIAEVSIPAMGGVASFIQGFTEPSEGKSHVLDWITYPIIGDYKVVGDQLVGSYQIFYDGSSKQNVGAFTRSSDLSVKGTASDLFALQATVLIKGRPANQVRFTNNIVVDVPPSLQAPLGGQVLVGGCCTNISGGSSNGPAAFAWDIFAPTTKPVTPLVYYTTEHPLDGAFLNQSKYWNGSTKNVCGFIADNSLVFLYHQGMGLPQYGVGGAVPPAVHAQPWFYDPVNSNTGVHAYPYEVHAMAFDIKTLIANRDAGTPWVSRPYADWTVTLPNELPSGEIRGCTYDAVGQRLFVEQMLGNGVPEVEVFHVN